MAIKYNMEFYTHITIPKTPFTFSYTVQTVLLGSCFAENIGKIGGKQVQDRFEPIRYAL